MQVAIKTVKYAVATFIAIFIAQWLQLDYAVSAGIIAILSLAETNRATIVYIGNLSLTIILGLITATLIFQLFGYHIWVFALFLAIVYPISVFLKSDRAIAPCAVSVSHLFVEQTTEFSWLMNEVLLLVIGAGIAMLVNLYQPSMKPRMEKIRKEVEYRMQNILRELAVALEQPDLFHELTDQLDQLENEIIAGLALANMERANQLKQNSFYFIEYFEMRKEQLAVLFEMEDSLQELTIKTNQNTALAAFLKHISEELHEKNPAYSLRRELEKLMSDYRHSELPRTREEFESRAILFEILTDCRKFLKIKSDFYARLRVLRRYDQLG